MTAKTYTTYMSRTTVITIWMALFVILMMLKTTTAFHHNVAMVGQTTRRDGLLYQRDFGGNNFRRTSLQYSSISSNNDGTTETSSALSQRWWKSLLSPSVSASAGAASINTAPSSTPTPTSARDVSQQETVDAYLEFLDRRYRRLHSDEEEARKRKVQSDAAAISGSKSVPFSAMDWLMNGSSQSSNVQLERQQQEDALYVLGVAGLASQKLLQKHHLQMQAAQSSDLDDDIIEVQAESEPNEDAFSSAATAIVDIPSHIFIKKVLVPIIRAMYVVQRRKDQLVHRIQSQVAALVSKAAQVVVIPVARRIRQGPKAIAETLLEIGGGKRNLALTLACAYAMVVALRPILQVTVTEASMRP
jgi:hypothetical protein